MITKWLQNLLVDIFDSARSYGALSAAQMAAWDRSDTARKKLDELRRQESAACERAQLSEVAPQEALSDDGDESAQL